MAARSREAGGAKKPANGAAWKSPPKGYETANPRRYLYMQVRRRDFEPEILANCPSVFAQLQELLGDHPVEVSVGRVNGSAWNSGLPWKQQQYTVVLKLPISQLASKSTWTKIRSCIATGDDFLRASAVRGGGAHRHVVWELSTRIAGVLRAKFQLAIRHIHENHYPDLRELVVRYFESMTVRGEVVGGTAELVDVESDDGYPCIPAGWSFERYFAREVEEEAFKQGQIDAIAMPRWIMLLSDAQVHKLGGIDRLRAGAAEARLQSRIAWGSGAQHSLPEDGIDVHKIQGGAVVFLSTMVKVLQYNIFGERFYSGDLSAFWLWGQIQAAGLTPDMRDVVSQKIKRVRAAASERVTSRSPGKSSTYNLTADLPYLRKHPPRGLHPSCSTSQASDPPFKLAQNCTCFRLRATGGDPAVTIYGAKRKDTDGLSSPIFVGSLDKDRAALHFDERLHGHDGENSDPAPESALGKRRLSQFACPSCGSRLFLASAVFEYPDDIGEVETAKDRSRRQDFFSWFWLNARCAACAWTGEVASIECA